MNNFEIIIGIEIHLELNTKSKMFSNAPNQFKALANTNVDFTDIAYPGTLPVVNKEAIIKAIKLAKALKMEIDRELHFDRKNYFYADLPKGFQITQQLRPIGKNGIIPIGNEKQVMIERIHLEEDTARSYHDQNITRLDYNRAGTPLIEIVTAPVLRSGEEARNYIKMIRDTARILGISDAKMEEGSLRADINISVRPFGSEKFGTKVEIKNLNSLANVIKAVERETALQIKSYLEGQETEQATKRFDEKQNAVVVMRHKSDVSDYRYFPEPNIPIIALSEKFIDEIEIAELPWMIENRLQKNKIDQALINQLIADPLKMAFVNQFEEKYLAPGIKLFFAEVIAYLNNKQLAITDLKIDPQQLILLIKKQEAGLISGKHIKQIVVLMLQTNEDVETIIVKNNFSQISDSSILEKAINQVIEANNNFIKQNEDRYERVFKFIVGQVMKQTKGQANPVLVSKLVQDKLRK